MNRDILKCQWVFQSLPKELVSLCALEHGFNILAGSLQFCFTLHFFFAQNLKVSHRWDLGPSLVCLRHVHSSASRFPPFPLKLLVNFMNGFCDVKQLPLFGSEKHPGEKTLYWVQLNKDKPCEWNFLRSCQTGQIKTQLCVWNFWGAPLVAARLLVFTAMWLWGCWFWRLA